MILDSHHDHVFLKKGDVMFLQNLLWMISAVGVLAETEHSKLVRYL